MRNMWYNYIDATAQRQLPVAWSNLSKRFNMTIIPQKRCSSCGVLKDTTAYYKDRSAKDGLFHRCKTCHTEKARKWREQNHERHLDNFNRWRTENDFYDRERKAAWYQANSSQERERVRQWRANNPDKRRAQIRAYRKSKPDKIRTIMQRRRARKYQQGGCYTEAQWLALKAQYAFMCLRCHRCEPEIRLTADHVIPIARGGSSYIENIQPLCDDCNRWKNVRTVDYRGQLG
jgi:5-methylcytosine-specific restriction endonuclease McrA